MTDSQAGQLVILATTVGGFLVAEWRASRNRRWAEEDRLRNIESAREERKAATDEIIARAQAEAEATRITLRAHTELTAAGLRDDVRQATAAAHVAYKEANDVNLKIANLNQRLLSRTEVAPGGRRHYDDVARIEKIDATTERIEARLTGDEPAST